MSDSIHEVKVKRQEAFAVFLRERQIHEMALLVADGWQAFARVGSYVFSPESMNKPDPDEVKPYLLAILTRVMDYAQVEDPRFSPLTDPQGRVNRHVYRDLERALTKIDPVLKKRLSRLSANITDANRVISQGLEPDATAEERRKSEAILLQKENILESACERAINMRKKQEAAFEPQVVIFQGGGANGMAYSGVTDELEKSGALKKIKYVAGNSSGALFGLLVAMGYPAREIEDLVQNGRFAQFFAESTLPISLAAKYKDRIADTFKGTAYRLIGKRYRAMRALNDAPQTEGIMLQDFSLDYMLPALEKYTGLTQIKLQKTSEEVIHQKLLQLNGVTGTALADIYQNALTSFQKDMEEKGLHGEAQTLQFVGMFGRSEAMQAAVQSIRYAKSRVDPECETIEEFFGDIIQTRLDRLKPHVLEGIVPPLSTRAAKRNLTFRQLQQLAEKCPNEDFKEFGVAMTDHFVPLTPRMLRRFCSRLVDRTFDALSQKKKVDDGFGVLDNRLLFKPVFARAANKDGKFGEHQDMPIKTAVRASMNLPFLFKVMKVKGMNLIDGAFNNNFPSRMFADKFKDTEEADERTIGFMFSTIESDLEYQAVDDLVKNKGGKLKIMLDEEIQKQMYQFEINALGVQRSSIIKRHWDRLKLQMLRTIAGTVKDFLAHHNPQITSEEALNNIGIIRTGNIDITDFHISKAERSELHRAGKIAALNLMSVHSDRHLRFAICRLRSLSQKEAAMSRKLGLGSYEESVLERVIAQAQVAQVIENPMLDLYRLGEVLQGRV